MILQNITFFKNPVFYNSRFRHLMFGLFFFNCAEWIERLCISWLILKTTESILATTISFAIGQIVQTLFSPFTGAAADKFGRNKIVIIVGFSRFFVLCILALFVYQNKNFLVLAYIASAITGLSRALIVPALQGSVINAVKENQKIFSMLIYSIIFRSTGVIGSLIGGVFSIFIGIEQAILLSGLFGLSGGIYLLLIALKFNEIKNKGNYFKTISTGLKLVFGNLYTRNLLIFAGIVEIFGFSFLSLLSSISKYILRSEIGTLSFLQSSMSLGAIVGILFLFKWKDINKAHFLAYVVAIFFGISILFISIFPNIISVLFFLAIIGGSTACFDAVQWIFIQKNIPDEFRSTAVSAWFITIGFGWIGHFFLGYSSDKFGLEITIMITGTILILSGLIYLIVSRRY